MIQKTFFFLLFFISNTFYSQEINLDKYQYIVVANKFNFLKQANKYDTSSLTKFLLKKKGFKVFLDNENLPNAIVKNRCLALTAKVINVSSMLTTKTKIQFTDCSNKIVYISKAGKSKSKDYRKGYHEAIRKAYNKMDDFIYSYNPSSNLTSEIDKDVIDTETNSITKAVVVKSQPKKTINKGLKNNTPINILFAQSIPNGFQLVNTKPEVVYKVLKSNLKDVFIIENINGICYKVGEKWVVAYYVKEKLVQKEYQIKF